MIDDSLARMLEVVITLSPIPLTAGSVLRIIEAQTGSNPASRTTVQKRLDDLVKQGSLASIVKTVEKNGHMINARHYRKKG